MESYRILTLIDNKVEGYKSSTSGDIANCYSPLQNLDRTNGRGNFTSGKLQWDSLTPLQMEVLPEYDGSVNIIINDDKNEPKSINSGFSVTENNTYLIPEHYGNAVTNIYDEETLQGDVSLFKFYNRIPTLTYNGLTDAGSLKCGSYIFYFRLCDTDGNVTNVIQESGVVQIHVGKSKTKKIRMGLELENTHKAVSFTLSDIDKTYDYVRVYYEVSTSGETGNFVTQYHMIDKNYPIKDSTCDIEITGAEPVVDELTLQDIQMRYADIQTAKTHAVQSNILFLGNVSQHEEHYDELRKLAWRIIPEEIEVKDLGHINQDYKFFNGYGYYDTENVYKYVGYWPDELYRFGVVFIFENNKVSPVYNIQGCDFATELNPKHYQKENGEYWDYEPDDLFFRKDKRTNSRGVIHFSPGSVIDTSDHYIIKAKGISFDFSGIVEDLQDLHITGLYFVRQKRIPTIYGQGVVIGLTGKDNGSLPVIQKEGQYVSKSFLRSNRLLGGSTFEVTSNVTTQALLMPDAELQEGTFNDLFHGEEWALFPQGVLQRSGYDGDHYYLVDFKAKDQETGKESVKLTTVPVDTKRITDGESYFSSISGYAADAIQITDLNHAWDLTRPQDLTMSTSLVRGQWGSYIGMSPNNFQYGTVVNIKENVWITNPNQMDQAFEERMRNAQPYFAISTRYNLDNTSEVKCFGGDCYSSVFTHKMMNNFADTEYPTNTKIVDPKCWAKNFVVRATAIRKVGTMSNIGDGGEGFYVDTKDIKDSELVMENGAAPFCNQIAEEVTYDVSIYPMSTKDDLGYKKEKEDDDNNVTQVLKGLANKDGIDSTSSTDDFITYQDDVIIGQTKGAKEGNRDMSLIGGNIIGILVMPITSIVAMARNRYWYEREVNIKDSFNQLRLTPKEPAAIGVGVIDAALKVSFNRNHNQVHRGKTNINRADVNAVATSQWITFPICSSMNLAMRDIEFSNTTEEAAHNRKRAFYPWDDMDADVHLPESRVINQGIRKSISTDSVDHILGIPYIKSEFFNRIYWSKPVISSQFIDNYRLIYEDQKAEYSKEFGAITKLVPVGNELLIVFQHGLGTVELNLTPAETEVSQYVASRSVLSSTPRIQSRDMGSMWQDSIISIDNHAVFGVDTSEKKIWMFVPDQAAKVISDYKVSKFLIDFIDLSEFDFNEYLGHINVKTHYNAYKNDVIFTFYKDKAVWELPDDWNRVAKKRIASEFGYTINEDDSTEKFKLLPIREDGQLYKIVDNKINLSCQIEVLVNEKTGEYKVIREKYDYQFIIKKGGIYDQKNRRLDITPIVKSWTTGTTWSLCYSLLLQQFVTFYDWYPVLSENIDNVFFSFDKDAVDEVLNSDLSKYIQSPSAVSKKEEASPDVVISGRVIISQNQLKHDIDRAFNNDDIEIWTLPEAEDKQFSATIYLPQWQTEKAIGACYAYNSKTKEWEFWCPFNQNGVVNGSVITLETDGYTKIADYHTVTKEYLTSVGALVKDRNNKEIYKDTIKDCPFYHLRNSAKKETMKLWKHGEAGLYDNASRCLPTNWYGKQHEFNFEFVVKDDYSQKIWNNLLLISNKAEPGKFEYEIVGEAYDWHEYKPIIEWINSQEAQTDPDYWWKYVLGKTASEIQETYPDFPDFYMEEQYGVEDKERKILKLPYLKMKLTDKKGSPERPIYSWDPENPKDFWQQLAAHPNDKFSYNCNETCLVQDDQLNEQRIRTEQLGNDIKKYGRVRGNMHYKGDMWNVEIRPIYFKWCFLKGENLAFKMVENRNQDKYIKIKVRYSGEDLALITALITNFDQSYV